MIDKNDLKLIKDLIELHGEFCLYKTNNVIETLLDELIDYKGYEFVYKAFNDLGYSKDAMLDLGLSTEGWNDEE